MSIDLTGLHVLVTRPKPAGLQLSEEIITRGGQATYFPTIEITPIRESIPQFDRTDWLIFISPQAVLQGIPLLRQYWPVFPDKIKLAAIGEGTAKLLHSEGFIDIIHPPANDWSSEGLLKLPHFQAVSGKHIVLVKGMGGREVLSNALTERGAIVKHIVAYQRILPKYENIDSYLLLFRQKKIDIIVCTSGESLQNLMTLIGTPNQALLLHVPMVVVSERLVLLAKGLGFKNVFLAANASHNAIIDTLSFIKGNGHVRK